MTAVNLNDLSASGPLESFGQLTALTDLRLAYNRFSGAWEPHARALVTGLCVCSLLPRVKEGKGMKCQDKSRTMAHTKAELLYSCLMMCQVAIGPMPTLASASFW